MQRKLDNRAFTFVEIIVVVTIIGILSTIGFNQFVGNISSGRDTLRKSDMANIISSMKTYKQSKGGLPFPAESFSGTNNGIVVFWQGKLNKNVSLSTIDEIPLDPILKIPYLYSISPNKKEFEIALTLENEKGEYPLSFSQGNYKSVAKTVLPTIIIATGSTSDVEIKDLIGNGTENRKLFIFSNQNHNLAYNFDGNEEPISDGTDFNDLLAEAEQNGVFSQNSSFEACLEIKKAGKSIGEGDYELRSNTGALVTINCDAATMN